MKKLGLILLILCAVIGIPVAKKIYAQQEVNEIVVEALVKRVIRSSVIASGNLTHEERVLIRTEVIGQVKDVYISEGDAVVEGDLLLQIDDKVIRRDVDQSRAGVRGRSIAVDRQNIQIKNLEKKWSRQSKLFEKHLVDEHSFEEVTHALQLAKSDLEANKELLVQANAQLAQSIDRLNKTKIFAPISGIVTSLDIKVGEMAIASTSNFPGSSLLTIANPLSVQTEVRVDEADIAQIALGQTAKIFTAAHPDTAIYGKVAAIASSAKIEPGRQSLSFSVKIRFDEITARFLKSGMSCRAEIFVDQNESTFAVPVQAVLKGRDDEHYIFVHKNGKVDKRVVAITIADDDYQSVFGDLSVGIEVVIGPDKTLREMQQDDRVVVAKE